MVPVKNEDSPSTNFRDKELGAIDQSEIKDLYSNILSKDSFGRLVWQQTREMINNLDNRIHYWNDRRTQFLTYAMGILGASVAGIITLIPKLMGSLHLIKPYLPTQIIIPLDLILYLPLAISLSIFIVGSLNIIVLWNRQNNPDYPFIIKNNIWRWHYRNAETSSSNPNINNLTEEEISEEVKKYIENEKLYKQRTLRCSEINLFDQDLSQLYLLLINEKYKVHFISELRNRMFKVINFSCISFLISMVLLILIRVFFT